MENPEFQYYEYRSGGKKVSGKSSVTSRFPSQPCVGCFAGNGSGGRDSDLRASPLFWVYPAPYHSLISAQGRRCTGFAPSTVPPCLLLSPDGRALRAGHPSGTEWTSVPQMAMVLANRSCSTFANIETSG